MSRAPRRVVFLYPSNMATVWPCSIVSPSSSQKKWGSILHLLRSPWPPRGDSAAARWPRLIEGDLHAGCIPSLPGGIRYQGSWKPSFRGPRSSPSAQVASSAITKSVNLASTGRQRLAVLKARRLMRLSQPASGQRAPGLQSVSSLCTWPGVGLTAARLRYLCWRKWHTFLQSPPAQVTRALVVDPSSCGRTVACRSPGLVPLLATRPRPRSCHCSSAKSTLSQGAALGVLKCTKNIFNTKDRRLAPHSRNPAHGATRSCDS